MALSPLAIALVAGYAVGLFFALLDGAVKGVPTPRNG
jgi:xanthosine utilization system XapX-like protein